MPKASNVHGLVSIAADVQSAAPVPTGSVTTVTDRHSVTPVTMGKGSAAEKGGVEEGSAPGAGGSAAPLAARALAGHPGALPTPTSTGGGTPLNRAPSSGIFQPKTPVGPIRDVALVDVSPFAEAVAKFSGYALPELPRGLIVIDEASDISWPKLIAAFDRDRKIEEKSTGPIGDRTCEGSGA